MKRNYGQVINAYVGQDDIDSVIGTDEFITSTFSIGRNMNNSEEGKNIMSFHVGHPRIDPAAVAEWS
ncbi:hypothetical protein TNCV_4165921 [Trichonephila clavipes]|nr:hypothetical protein TNCV_4165921 [Trichonephila clavipes]